MSHNGKGSAPRPLSVSAEEFARRWERAFVGRVDAFCGVCGFQRATDPACEHTVQIACRACGGFAHGDAPKGRSKKYPVYEKCDGTGRLPEAKEAA